MSEQASTAFKVTISGYDTPCLEFHSRHSVDDAVATGSLVLPTPMPGHVGPAAQVRIEAGYYGQLYTTFYGQVADDAMTFDEQGGTVRLAIEGWAKRLWHSQNQDIVLPGVITLKEIFRALCARQQVPFTFADETTFPNGTSLLFAGVSQVPGGNAVTVPADSAPGEVIDRLSRLYGYRCYDTPIGVVRLKKISGLPNPVEVVRSYNEGVNLLSVGRTRTMAGMVNYWEIKGVRYTASDGSEVAIRSIPLTVPSDPRLGPTGVSRKSISDDAIVTQTRADHCRNVMEIDYSTPRLYWRWTTIGDAEMSPGHVVQVNSPTIGGGPTTLWLMSVAQDFVDGSWTTSMEGWAGAGMALPAGDDCATQTLVGNGGFHIGNETLSHYRRPVPDGTTRVIPFSVANGYSTLTIRGFAHGCNSFATNAASTASRFELWQGGAKVAEGEMPRLNEDLEQRLNYTVDATWERIVVPLSGSLAAGSAELRIIAGFDSTVGDVDDYECRNLVLTTCGIGQPIIL